MTVYLIRHGETTANASKTFAGISDVDLTEKGISQAEVAAEKLKDIKLDAVFSSDLKRAKETAHKIAEKQDLHIQAIDAFREMNFGIWEGKKFAEIKASDPERLQLWFDDFEHFVVPEGESVKEMFERVTEAYKQIITKFGADSDKQVAIVAHGGVIQALLSFLCFDNVSGYWKFRVDNCGINKIEYVMGESVIQGLNQ